MATTYEGTFAHGPSGGGRRCAIAASRFNQVVVDRLGRRP